MGVRRLTTFVAGAGVFERCSAGASHPISVVIDASGVIFHCLSTLDSAGNPLWLHLGPSLAIEREFTRFFQEIKVSFIDPLVVFDGVSVGRTALRQERLGQSLPMCQSTATFFAAAPEARGQTPAQSGVILPCGIVDMVLNILSELKIEFMFSEGEADPEIARQSKLRNALVIASDSDFYVYDIPGYIPLKSLKPDSASQPLSFDAYCRDRLLLKLQLTSAQLSIFATFMSNDVVSYDRLKPFFQSNFSGHVGVWEIAGFVRAHTLEQALEKVLEVSSKSAKVSLIADIRASIDGYNMICDSLAPIGLFEFAHEGLRSSLQEQYRNGTFSVSIVNLALLKQYWCMPFVGDLNRASPWEVTDSLRMLLYTAVCSREGETVTISEFDTIEKAYSRRRIFVSCEPSIISRLHRPVIDFFRGVPSSRLPDKSVCYLPFLQLLGLSPAILEGVDEQFCAGLICLHYFFSNVKLTTVERNAFLSFVVCSHKQRDDCPSFSSLPAEDQLLLLQLRFKQIHLVSQWQQILTAMSNLNEAYFSPVDFSKVWKLANASCLHLLIAKGSSGPNSNPPESPIYQCTCAPVAGQAMAQRLQPVRRRNVQHLHDD